MKRNHKQTKRSTNSAMQDARCVHVLSFLTQTSTKIWYTRTTGGTITYSPYTYRLVIPTIKDFIVRLTWLVTCTGTQSINNHFWTLRASTHEQPPCVLRHTGNAYAVSHIFTHTLPSTIEMAPRRSTLNGQCCIRHNNVSTSRTLALRDIQG